MRSKQRSASRLATIRSGLGLHEVTARMRSSAVARRVGRWFDDLQTDLRGAARQRLADVSTSTTHLVRQMLMPNAGPRPLVNATGCLLMPGASLPLAEQAIAEAAIFSRDYSALHIPLDERSASSAVEKLVTEFTGAEAAAVFSNQAAALWAVLHVLARDKRALVARGHVVDALEGCGLPDIAAAAGSTLWEVGVVNRATADDFRRALSERSGLVLRWQPDDFTLAGRVDLASLDELATLAAGESLPLVDVLPSASLIDLAPLGIEGLPLVGNSLLAGADLVLFRGDNLIGGPGCCIVAGRRHLVEQITADPMSPLLAAGPLELAALAATLRLYRTPETALRSIPLLQMISASSDHLKHRADRLAMQLRPSASLARVEVGPGHGWLTSARLPHGRLASWSVRIEMRHGDADRLAARLLRASTPVLCELDAGHVLLNLRSVLPGQDQRIVAALDGASADSSTIPASSSAAHSSSPPMDVIDQAE